MAEQRTDIEAAAARHLRRPVVLSRTIPLPGGHIEVWRSRGRLPSRTAPYFVAPDGASFRTDASWAAFGRMLKAARPEVADTALMASLIGCAPDRRVLASEPYLVPERLRDSDWRPRILEDGTWIGHCSETIAGRWERLTIRPDLSLNVIELDTIAPIKIR